MAVLNSPPSFTFLRAGIWLLLLLAAEMHGRYARLRVLYCVEVGAQQTLAEVQSLVDVLLEDITVEEGDQSGGNRFVVVRKKCSCLPSYKQYLANTTLTVRSNGGTLGRMVKKGELTRVWHGCHAEEEHAFGLHLLCGCSSSVFDECRNLILFLTLQDIEAINNVADQSIGYFA